ncbi:MAG: sulfatase-like hydrolase/transferase [Cellulosilyticaceae bacterium]
MKKNIVFLLTDDQRFDTIHALGNEAIKTPNMDRLVQMGTSFTQAHIPSGTSGAICMPSRAMIHSGRTLFHIEKEGQNIPKAHITLGEHLRSQGYDTFATGKWHNGIASFARSFSGGDNIFFGGMWDHWHVPVSHFDPTGTYDNVKPYTTNFQHSNQTIGMHCDKITVGIHSTDLFTQTALDYLETRDQSKPFLLYVSYLAPHDPRTMPKEYANMYDAKQVRLPDNFVSEHPFEMGIEDIRAEALAVYPRQEAEIKQHIADYYAMITHLDDQIGRILDKLEEQGILEETLIVFAGDNGLNIGHHGYMAKQTHYETSIRIPLIFTGAGVKADHKVNAYVYLMDIYPTLCELIGIPIPESVEGQSMKAALDGNPFEGREHLYFAYNDLIRSVKSDGYKLIRYKNAPEHTQLFNVDEDPWECHNLYRKPEYQEHIRQLQAVMEMYKETWENTNHPYTQSFWGEEESR